MTDGAVGNEEELFRIVAARLGDGRLFTVGIGSAPNSYFMRKSAELGRGSFTHIGDLAEVKPRMDALLAKLEQPALTDLRIGWPLGLAKRAEVYPAPLPDLYAGAPLSFTARLEGIALAQVDGQLLVTGNSLDGAWQQRLALDDLTPAPGTAAVWARAKLAQIEDGLYRGGEADRTAIRAEALALALDHQLVTRYTSLVAIDEAIARPEGEGLETAEIPRDLPAGWDAGKVFGEQATTSGSGASATPSAMPAPPAAMRSFTLPAPLLQRVKAADGQAVSLPQTATPAERMAIVGGAYVLLSLALLLLVLRRSKKAGRLG
jgi:Ca-activated chloride channel family protein